MVQMKDTATFDYWRDWPGFISHMVQMKEDYKITSVWAFMLFISHMVQMKVTLHMKKDG